MSCDGRLPDLTNSHVTGTLNELGLEYDGTTT